MARQEQVTRKRVTKRAETYTDASVLTESPEHAQEASDAATRVLEAIDDTLEEER